MSLLSATVLLILVMDPLGNVPLFLVALQKVDSHRRSRVILRELCIALGVLVVFLFGGRLILTILHVDQPSLSIAGGIVLFLIALGMIFPIRSGMLRPSGDAEPLVVPLAVPLVAGPSAIATVMLLMSQAPDRWPDWLAAVIVAWLVSLAILTQSSKLERIIGDRGLDACERLMGMILTIIAVQMFMDGISAFLRVSLAGQAG